MNQEAAIRGRIAIILWLLILSVYLAHTRSPKGKPFGRNVVTFNSIRCIDHDKNFSRFAYCRLKPVNRTLKLLSVRVLLLKPPVTQSDINVVILKKANGYKPFIFNFTLDICDYFGGHRNLAINWLFEVIYKHSNINHSCPYTDDMIVENMPMSQIQLPTPLPEGEYRFDVVVYAFHILRATFSIFMSISEN